jgi:DNA-binding NarL/FixJ family response regulator
MLEGSPEYEVVGEGSTARDAFGILGTVAADLVVLDSVLPGFGGALIIQAIRRRAPAVRVLILSDNCAVRDAAEAMAAGAAGYALKGDGVEEILRAFAQIRRGRRYVAPALARRLSNCWGRSRRSLRSSSPPKSLVPLSVAEGER